MKFSVCTDAVFQNTDTVSAMHQVKECGIDAIEFWGWWDKDIDAINTARKEWKMTVAAFCTQFISLTDPSQRQSYLEGLRETMEVARLLDCKHIISQVGQDTGAPREEQRASIIAGLKECVPLLKEWDITLVIEPLNLRHDHAGYYLSTSEESAEIIDAVNDSHVRLLYDCYHQQITEGDIICHINQLGERIGHVHTAGNPGRHELDRGEMYYPAIFTALEEQKFSGYAGLEYFPREAPEEGLRRLKSL